MFRLRAVRWAKPLLVLLSVAVSCSKEAEPEAPIAREPTQAESEAHERREAAAVLDRDFPLHGLVTRVQLTVRDEPNPEGRVIGWLRWGERLRLKEEATRTPTCASGWYALHPRGFACAGQGIDVGEAPPEVDDPVAPAHRDQPLPYAYYFVKDRGVPQYHMPPSRQQQRDADAFSRRYLELLDRGQDRRADQFMAGQLPGGPAKPAVVSMFLQRGFWVAATDVLVRAERRFVRSTAGGFVKEVRLEERQGSAFHGVELGEERQLPVPFTLRDIRPRIRRVKHDGSLRFVRDLETEVILRQEVPASWRARERHGDDWYHRFESEAWDGPRFARDWFVGLAERIEAPFEVAEDEPWVHVDLSSQTLVLYRGENPVYATLVSTGVDGHDTPLGTFTIRKKMVTDTMSDLGPDSEDAYRIQDVPWTQYFQGSFAIHGAFWHSGFGVRRSHGCINLAPADAQRVFRETWPQIPDGWHGASTDRSGFQGSRIHITE